MKPIRVMFLSRCARYWLGSRIACVASGLNPGCSAGESRTDGFELVDGCLSKPIFVAIR